MSRIYLETCFVMPIIVVRVVYWLPVVTNTYVTSFVIVIHNKNRRRPRNMLSITGEHAVTQFPSNVGYFKHIYSSLSLSLSTLSNPTHNLSLFWIIGFCQCTLKCLHIKLYNEHS